MHDSNQQTIIYDTAQFVEFPAFVSGTYAKNNINYFDATGYIEYVNSTNQPQKQINILDFIKSHKHLIEEMLENYEIDSCDVFFVNKKDGHTVIVGTLAIPFLMYVDCGFAWYLIERMTEMMMNGYVLSDSALLNSVYSRFNLSFLKTHYDNIEERR